jgi:hypothetical protein
MLVTNRRPTQLTKHADETELEAITDLCWIVEIEKHEEVVVDDLKHGTRAAR